MWVSEAYVPSMSASEIDFTVVGINAEKYHDRSIGRLWIGSQKPNSFLGRCTGVLRRFTGNSTGEIRIGWSGGMNLTWIYRDSKCC
jgi:hypothetical protein